VTDCDSNLSTEPGAGWRFAGLADHDRFVMILRHDPPNGNRA
jgi:hypothetical protein